MKKGIFTVAAGICLLIACNQTKNNSATGGNQNDHAAMAKRNSENTKIIYRAIETGDVGKLDSFIAKDVVDHDAVNGRDIKGLDSLKYYLGQMHTFFDGLKMELLSDATSADGTYYYAIVRMTGKAKQNPWNIPVGMNVDDMYVDVIKIKDGKASEHWGFTSEKDVNERIAAAMKGSGKMPPAKNQ